MLHVKTGRVILTPDMQWMNKTFGEYYNTIKEDHQLLFEYIYKDEETTPPNYKNNQIAEQQTLRQDHSNTCLTGKLKRLNTIYNPTMEESGDMAFIMSTISNPAKP